MILWFIMFIQHVLVARLGGLHEKILTHKIVKQQDKKTQLDHDSSSLSYHDGAALSLGYWTMY